MGVKDSQSVSRKSLSEIFILCVAIMLVFVLWHHHTIEKRKNPFTTDLDGSTYTRQVILSEPNASKEYRLKAHITALVNVEQVDEGAIKNEVSVDRVYWPNGGFTTFGVTDKNLLADPCVVDSYNVGYPVKCTASNGSGKTYDVELLAPTY